MKKRIKNKTNMVFNILNIILALLSLFIALIALKSITKVEGFAELLRNTSENTIILQEMIKAQKEQNSLQQMSIDDNKHELDEIKLQTKVLIDLNESNINQLEILLKEDKSQLIKDYFTLSNIYWEIDEFRILQSLKLFSENKYQQQTLSLLNKLKSNVHEGVSNKLLKMNNEIYSHWWVFYQQIDFTINHIKIEPPLEKYYNIKQSITYGNSRSKEESDLEILSQFKKYFNTFWIKGVQPMINMEEMRSFEKLYLELSDHGRPINE